MEDLILARDFCVSHNIEITFIDSLQQTGLVEITIIEETAYIHIDQVSQLEKIVRLHYDLDINLEGIETIIHLLERITDMQHEITSLKNRLQVYNEGE